MNRLRALPEDQPTHFIELLSAGTDGEKMIATQLACLAGEPGASIGDENLSFTDAGWVQQDLAGGRGAGGILGAQAELQVPQGHPGRFPAPPGLEQLAVKGKEPPESGAGQRSFYFLEIRQQHQGADGDPDQCSVRPRPSWTMSLRK